MKKTFRMSNLECAVCASKMEKSISKLQGVENVNVNFITQKITIEAEDEKFNEIMKSAQNICKKYERDCEILGF